MTSWATRGQARALLDQARALTGRCRDPGILARFLHRTEHTLRIRPGPPQSHARGSGLAHLDGQALTDRERAVLRLLASDLSLREIAGELHISHNTVKTQTRSIYRKLQVSGRDEAVTAARRSG